MQVLPIFLIILAVEIMGYIFTSKKSLLLLEGNYFIFGVTNF